MKTLSDSDVAQGSVLGSLLRISYINEIDRSFGNSLSVDDTFISTAHDHFKRFTKTKNSEVNILCT